MSFDAYNTIANTYSTDAPISARARRTEFIDCTEYHNGLKDDPEIAPTPTQNQAKKNPQRYEEYSLVLRRLVQRDKKGETTPKSTRLEVRDEVLQKVLRQTLDPIKYLGLASTPLCISQPFRELFWFREEIKQYEENNCKKDKEKQSFELLSNFMANHLGQLLKESERLISKRIIVYEHIWMVFRPGSLAISPKDGQAFLIRSFHDPPDFITPPPPATIKCLVWGCDPKAFGPSERTVELERFTGSRDILELPLYPFDFMPKKAQEYLLQIFIQRGMKWKSLINMCHKYYKGIGWELSRKETPQTGMDWRWRQDSSEISAYHRTQRQVNGRIMLDHTTAMECNPGSTEPLINFLYAPPADDEISEETGHTEAELTGSPLDFSRIYRRCARDPSYSMSNEEAIICPSTVRGYSLKDKCWMDFSIDSVQDIDWDESCLSKLQIDEEIRKNLASMVLEHAEMGYQMKDVVTEKGKGLTFLFHGPPGCGKTLTAEVLAEHTKKPLLRITSGDLGTKPGEAEKKIQEAFRLASAWKAIILLDEADVFLAKRKTGDVARNAFVTVFLCSMEYYAGTLMLTTNQPNAFDEAFQSRIHLQIPYPPLNGTQRKAIWSNVVEDQGIQHDLNEEAFARLGENVVRNGREIKNLIQLALLIAKTRKVCLNEEIINLVCGMDRREAPSEVGIS